MHNFKLEVEDRAGNISHDFFLQIIVDTTMPPASFGLPDATNAVDGLAAESDSGVSTVPATYADRVTNDTTPKFWGRAEANSIVRLYHDTNANGLIDLTGPTTDTFLGQAVAVPLDGNDAYPNGYWEIQSALDLNQIDGLPKDGLRRLLVTAEDVAGNPMPFFVGDFQKLLPTGRAADLHRHAGTADHGDHAERYAFQRVRSEAVADRTDAAGEQRQDCIPRPALPGGRDQPDQPIPLRRARLRASRRRRGTICWSVITSGRLPFNRSLSPIRR